MYRHCVYCAADLVVEAVVEEFPVGRRLAFDPTKGRLWVLCPSCRQWNLSPLEERWEALESMERAYRDTLTRTSTENIGLARLSEGLELVRVGRPQRPEFAAWRYGDQFGRRRRKFLTTAAIGGGIVAGAGLGSMAIAGLSAALLPLHLYNMAAAMKRRNSVAARIRTTDGRCLELMELELGAQKIRPSPDHQGGWCLDLAPWAGPGLSPAGPATRITADGPDTVLEGPDAVHALGLIMPTVNRAGAGRGRVREAVGLIEEAGSPEAWFRSAEEVMRRNGRGYGTVRAMPVEVRLALEMAAHEDGERAALEGELARLEEAWRDAEALAAIADDLALPTGIAGSIERLRQAASRGGGAPVDRVEGGKGGGKENPGSGEDRKP